jgi:hypothetical protein
MSGHVKAQAKDTLSPLTATIDVHKEAKCLDVHLRPPLVGDELIGKSSVFKPNIRQVEILDGAALDRSDSHLI